MELLIRGKQRAHYAFYGFGEAIPKEVPNLGAETRVQYPASDALVLRPDAGDASLAPRVSGHRYHTQQCGQNYATEGRYRGVTNCSIGVLLEISFLYIDMSARRFLAS